VAARTLSVSLVTPDVALLDAAIGDRPALGSALGCAVADGWDVFPGALVRARDGLAADPGSARWGTRLFVLADPHTLVGFGGFKGPPRDGVVELGYAIAPGFEGRGLATAAVIELVREAFEAPEVHRILAHTLAEPGASPRVLAKSGFVYDGRAPGHEVVRTWRFHLERTRANGAVT
jgi:ribosomal-protein-alanine N-acetyltransferase